MSDRYFPYPRDPARKIGFIIGDLIALAVLLLILLPISRFQSFDMEFGFVSKTLWLLAVVGILAAIWYFKRHGARMRDALKRRCTGFGRLQPSAFEPT